VERTTDGLRLVSADGTFQAEGEAPLGSTAWLAVRPEKIAIHGALPAAGANQLAGRLLDYGYLGDWTTYLVEIAPGRTIRAARANATRADDQPLACGDAVWLTFAPSSAMVLTR
ncbi:MAG: TOBE domain-containing protein, partial [Phenylobacterium sp.]|uniref:TOBE domain-containing protein n=1 Tax=Phenylobacterium sp. TaxID=1871053 RepID=UPI00273448CE